jgi:hypothetical protein
MHDDNPTQPFFLIVIDESIVTPARLVIAASQDTRL